MTNEYDINVESDDFKKRCTDIKALLTPSKIDEIIKKNRMQVAKAIYDDNKRCVFVVFASTASLLRCARGGSDEKVFNVASVTLVDARKCIPDSDLLNSCEGALQFCCVIATARPIMPREPVGISPLTIHTLCRMSVVLFDVECALLGADEKVTPLVKAASV